MNSFIYLVFGFYLLIGAFILVMHIKHLRDEGVQFTLFWKFGIWPWAIVGIALDVAFNIVAGTLMFFEFPHELMFTSRCKRHVKSEGWRLRVAQFWQRQLNQIDPGHV